MVGATRKNRVNVLFKVYVTYCTHNILYVNNCEIISEVIVIEKVRPWRP